MDIDYVNKYKDTTIKNEYSGEILDTTEYHKTESKNFSDASIVEVIEAMEESRQLDDDISNPRLFIEHEAGDYEYKETILGKSAFGTLDLPDEVQRNLSAQRSAGGADRKPDDDGGHLIGARFGGSSGPENLDAQNRQLNRGEYKAMENDLATHIESGDKVFLNVEALRFDGERPNSFEGYAIFEHSDGSRDSKRFSFFNESNDAQEMWGKVAFGEEDKAAALADMEYSDGLSADNLEHATPVQPEYHGEVENVEATATPVHESEPDNSESMDDLARASTQEFRQSNDEFMEDLIHTPSHVQEHLDKVESMADLANTPYQEQEQPSEEESMADLAESPSNEPEQIDSGESMKDLARTPAQEPEQLDNGESMEQLAHTSSREEESRSSEEMNNHSQQESTQLNNQENETHSRTEGYSY